MGKRIVYVDDLSGKEIPDGEGGPVRFSLQDEWFEMDLGKESLAKLEKALQPFMDKATSVDAPRPEPVRPARGAVRRASAPGRGGSGLGKDQLDAIRTWAKANGHQVADRGRIAASVIEAFEASHTK